MREFACDEVAANNGANSAPYLRTLLQIVERCERNQNASTIAFGRRPSEIVLRARRLVDISKDDQRKAIGEVFRKKAATGMLVGLTFMLSLFWIPTDPLASPRSSWSPWPSWTAKAAHCFGCNLRDYEQYDRRSQLFEIARQANNHPSIRPRLELNEVVSN
jgi:hypothetical protein